MNKQLQFNRQEWVDSTDGVNTSVQSSIDMINLNRDAVSGLQEQQGYWSKQQEEVRTELDLTKAELDGMVTVYERIDELILSQPESIAKMVKEEIPHIQELKKEADLLAESMAKAGLTPKDTGAEVPLDAGPRISKLSEGVIPGITPTTPDAGGVDFTKIPQEIIKNYAITRGDKYKRQLGTETPSFTGYTGVNLPPNLPSEFDIPSAPNNTTQPFSNNQPIHLTIGTLNLDGTENQKIEMMATHG